MRTVKLMLISMHHCDLCGMPEERVFQDTYTGISLCLHCLGPICDRITNSPASEGDNLRAILDEEVMREEGAP